MEYDGESNQYHTQFRQYEPPPGRWTSPDPSGTKAVSLSNPQTWNMYAYATNNPTTLTDPLGLDSNGNGPCYEYICVNPPNTCDDGQNCIAKYGMGGILSQYTAAYAGDPTVGTSAANSPMATMMAAANQLVSTVTGFFMNAVAIPGAGNPGYQGGGEIDLGFKYLVGQLVNDFKQEGDASAAAAAIDFAIAFGAIPTGSIDPHALAALDLDLQNEQSAEATEADLKSWQTSGNSPSPSPPSAACFASYAAYMNKWGKILAAWYKTTHQPPPPGMVPPPPPHAIDPEPTGGCSIARRNR
jgi:RHS repeat-associated protein